MKSFLSKIFSKQKSNKQELNNKIQEVLAKYKKISMRPCFKISVDEGIPKHLDSSIAGVFYLPEGKSIPIDSTGKQMFMFIQLNLEGTDLPNLPNKGILQVFIQDTICETEYEVRYYKEVNESYQKDIVPISGEWADYPIKLKLTKSESYPDYIEDDILMPLYDEVFDVFSSKVYNQIEKEIYNLTLDANYGGYGSSTQGKEFDYEKNEVLLTVSDTISPYAVYIGAGGILWVEIGKEDLANGDFEKAIVDWDCT